MSNQHDTDSAHITAPCSTTRRDALRLGIGGAALVASLTVGRQFARGQATPAPMPTDLPAPLDRWAAGWTALEAAQLTPLYTADAVFDAVALGTSFTGPDAIAGYLSVYFAAFSDASVTISSGFASEDRAAIEWTFSGAYTGQVSPLPPGTGQRVTYRGANVFTLRDGAITHETSYFDFATILIQLGLMPVPATPVP